MLLRHVFICCLLVVSVGVRSWEDIPKSLRPIAKQVQKLIEQHDPVTRTIHSLELFAGSAEYSNACARLNLKAVAYDKLYSDQVGTQDNDLTTEAGFARALELVLQVVPHGSLWAAPVCSTWGFVGRKGSFRTKESAVGDESVPRIRYANKMVYNLCLLLLAAYLIGLNIFVEQPHGSLMAHFWPFSDLARLLRYKITTYLHAFGHRTMKGLCIWSTRKDASNLRRKKPKEYETLCRKHDKGTTGKVKALKESQAYPRAFGEAVAEITLAALHECDMHDLFADDLAINIVNAIVGTQRHKKTRKCAMKTFVSKKPAGRQAKRR